MPWFLLKCVPQVLLAFVKIEGSCCYPTPSERWSLGKTIKFQKFGNFPGPGLEVVSCKEVAEEQAAQ